MTQPNYAHGLNAGLIGWWLALPHRSGGSVLPDITIDAAHAVLVNAPVWSGLARPGGKGSVFFNGASSQVAKAPARNARSSIFAASGGPGTFSAWLYWPTAPGATNGIIAQGSAYPVAWAISSDIVNSYTWTGESTDLAMGTIVAATWQHVLCTRDSAGKRGYLNGVQTASDARTGTMANTQELWIGGAELYTPDNFSTVHIDDVRVMSRSVTANEAWQIYNESRMGYPTMLRRR